MDKCTTVEDLKRVFKKLALVHHPDKGGDAETFSRLKSEYEARLRDLERPADPDEVLDLHVTLEEAYAGFTKTVPIISERRCHGCSQSCQMCHGKGVVYMTLGPLTLSHPCPMCEGSGGSHPTGCDLCKRTGKIVSRTEYTVTVPPGVDTGELFGRFRIAVKPHASFERQGPHLRTKIRLPFSRSIEGTTVTIRHLSGPLTIDTSQWAPLDPRIAHVIPGKGMGPHGDLHVIFDIQYK